MNRFIMEGPHCEPKKSYLSVTDPVSLGIINNFFPFLGGSPTASGRLRDRIERLRR